VVLVLDHLNTHILSALDEAFVPEEARRIIDKLELHYTPKDGSWLNMAEIELSGRETDSVWIVASAMRMSSHEKLRRGKKDAIPAKPRSTGVLLPRMLALNSNISTHQFYLD
jgi:hypothetical protein